jgi:surface antigen
MSTVTNAARFLIPAILAAWLAPTFADPPAHAPAHGWRKKHDPYYVGYSGKQWDTDYDVSSGHCNREAIAAVVGGVVGGAIGAKVGEENRAVATIIGAAVGALIGKKIGHELDEADRGCLGHALEIGTPGKVVVWTNASTGVRYELTPGSDRKQGSAVCRDFTLLAVSGQEKSSQQGVACAAQAGVWQVQP